MRRIFPVLCTIAVSFVAGLAARGAEVDFSGLALQPQSYWNGADETGGFSTGGMFFNNSYAYYPDTEYTAWSGWAYSNITNNAVGGPDNQYASITGGGISGAGSNYAIAFTYEPNDSYIDLGTEQVLSIRVTNTAYAYYSMKNGDPFAKKFGPTDWFKLTITGYSEIGAGGSSTGSVDFFLANGTNILNQWSSIDLTSLSLGARSLGFELTSSDNGVYGMNTPAFFTLGSLTVVPEPGTLILAGFAGLTLIVARKSRKMTA